jgi:hypothetical protein
MQHTSICMLTHHRPRLLGDCAHLLSRAPDIAKFAICCCTGGPAKPTGLVVPGTTLTFGAAVNGRIPWTAKFTFADGTNPNPPKGEITTTGVEVAKIAFGGDPSMLTALVCVMDRGHCTQDAS